MKLKMANLHMWHEGPPVLSSNVYACCHFKLLGLAVCRFAEGPYASQLTRPRPLSLLPCHGIAELVHGCLRDHEPLAREICMQAWPGGTLGQAASLIPQARREEDDSDNW